MPVWRRGESLAFYGSLIYDAKIQKAEFRKGEWKYFVHYSGWNKKWDEWVGVDRLLRPTEVNLEQQETRHKRQKAKDHEVDPEIVEVKIETQLGSRWRKRKGDPLVETKGEEPDDGLSIALSETLKNKFLDDEEIIAGMGMLVILPRTPSVEEIFRKFVNFKTKQDGLSDDSLFEALNCMNCIRNYFDECLRGMLYPQERARFVNAVSQGGSPSTIYGAENLLRLFVGLSESLISTNMEQEVLTQLQHKLPDFLDYFQRNHSIFFLFG